MRVETLELLRCPYCGGRVELKEELFHRRSGDDISDAVLGCHCCYFAIVAGIAILTLEEQADTARQQIEAGDPEGAALTLLGLDDDAQAARIADPSLTFRESVDLFGAAIEGGYFLFRFSDPTFVVADAVVRALGPALVAGGGRAVDLCGGSGHLTRTLTELWAASPVLMDLSFAKLWLARRFVAPGCEAVCADAHSPLPFASGAFRFAICNDAFHYIWTKALFAREMSRIIHDDGAVAITHVHNADQWNPSAGNPLPPPGYRNLFEGLDARVFGERRLLADAINGHVDLGRRESDADLSADPSLTVIAARREDLYANRCIEQAAAVRGRLSINPLYTVTMENGCARLTLRFPSEDYEEEYAACRAYLPDTTTLDRETLSAIESGARSRRVDELRARRVLLDLPKEYL